MEPAPPPRPKKKSGNGCLVALAILGGLVALTALVVGIVVWRFAGTKEGKAVFGAIGEAARIATEAQSAPGAAEVRALGCEQAMVFDAERMAKVVEQLADAGARDMEFSVVVVCKVGVIDRSPPSCDDVARTYRGALGAVAQPFAANVTRGGGRGGEICSALYDATGKKMRDLHGGSAASVPGGR